MEKEFPTHVKRAAFQRRKVSGVVWFVAVLFLVHFLACLLPEMAMQDYWDPQYVLKDQGLHAMLEKNSGHPLYLMMGSSRVDQGLRPDVITDRMSRENAPVLYNFGLGGADLFRQFICLKRVVESGIRPQRVGIEIMGAMMQRSESQFINTDAFICRARGDELADYRHYSLDPRHVTVTWYRSRLDPFFQYSGKMKHRGAFGRRVAELLGTKEATYDPWGWFPERPAPIPKAEYLKGLEFAKAEYRDDLVKGFKISEYSDRICRQILDYCKQEKLNVFLLRTPEGPDFQAFYPAEVNTAVDAFLDKIRNDYGVRFIDARSWIGTEGFLDGHHLNATGADEFTKRLAGELAVRP